eukprot:6657159-Prymnesium_polylepis.1
MAHTKAQPEDKAKQQYFYRAITLEEAKKWLSDPATAIASDSSQPWASYLNCSMKPKYLNGSTRSARSSLRYTHQGSSRRWRASA